MTTWIAIGVIAAEVMLPLSIAFHAGRIVERRAAARERERAASALPSLSVLHGGRGFPRTRRPA